MQSMNNAYMAIAMNSLNQNPQGVFITETKTSEQIVK